MVSSMRTLGVCTWKSPRGLWKGLRRLLYEAGNRRCVWLDNEDPPLQSVVEPRPCLLDLLQLTQRFLARVIDDRVPGLLARSGRSGPFVGQQEDRDIV